MGSFLEYPGGTSAITRYLIGERQEDRDRRQSCCKLPVCGNLWCAVKVPIENRGLEQVEGG